MWKANEIRLVARGFRDGERRGGDAGLLRYTNPRPGAQSAEWKGQGSSNSAFLRCDGHERSNKLMHARAAAVGAGHSAFIHIRHVKGLSKFLVAVLAMKYVLRHERAPPG